MPGSNLPGVVFVADLAAFLAYRNPAGRGQIVVALDNTAVGIVMNPAAAPVQSGATPFVPSDDNLTDLGSLTAEFRTLYLGTSIVNDLGSLAIDLQGGTPTTLAVGNSGGGPLSVANITADGVITGALGLVVGAGGTLGLFGGTARAQLGAIADPAGGGTVDTQARAAIVDILDRLRPTAGFGFIAP